MKRIDREIVQKVLDAANIVEVVSDFVSLKRRGANYTGLCPFHNERTPSFSVSPARGICKCFSCGKGGSAVNFIMEHEQLNFNEAIRYLAKKYNIEIKEHEMSDEERQRESARENMFAVNEFALKQFEQNLLETSDGRDIGYAYFRERGISDSAIARFHLGYSLEKGNALYDAATKAGYSEQALIETGLSVKREDGSIYDRFKGRVMYPVHTISGKVVAFGGRTLRNDKKIAKYVNSPESTIYTKSRELYGLYQAKKSIVEKNKCILVEGYMDVISMSQLGIQNVVASSGTSLTEGQIRLIHRFTSDVTVIYDSDPAGIKASLRGIDMLLAEGLNIKVVLLPEGEDPDSFAQSHSLSEVEEYLAQNETDFIRFKTDILLKGVENDPIRRSQVIGEIVRSISVIPDDITRTIYVQECARRLEINEKVILSQIKKIITERREKEAEKQRQDKARNSIATLDDTTPSESADQPEAINPADTYATKPVVTPHYSKSAKLTKAEEELITLIVKFGLIDLPMSDENENVFNIKVIDYVNQELQFDKITFSVESYSKILTEALKIAAEVWPAEIPHCEQLAQEERTRLWNEGTEKIQQTAANSEEIKAREHQLVEEIDIAYQQQIDQYTEIFMSRMLMSSPDDDIRTVSTRIATPKHQLSKIHSKFGKIEDERERLFDLLPRAIYGLKDALAECEINEIKESLKRPNVKADAAAVDAALMRMNELISLRKEYASFLGERVILPK